jgi:uncharacterized protein YkwD
VRGTSKLLSISLLLLALMLATVLTGQAAARTGGRAHHRGKRAGRHALRVHGKRAKVHEQKTKVLAPATTGKLERAKREKTSETAATKKLVAATEAAATIATILATPCLATEITPEPGNLQVAREAVFCLINHVRAEHSLAPLKLNPELQAAAEDHNAEMLQVDYFAHVAPDGETPVERIRKTGYIVSESDGYVIGENLAWGTYQLSTPKAIVEAWVASPGHLANILESRYTETGVGVTPAVPQSLAEGSPGATYAQEFGVLIP